jgi:hypothetical protein
MINEIFIWWTIIGFVCMVVLPGPSKFPRSYCKQVAIVEAVISGPIGWVLIIFFATKLLSTRKKNTNDV